VRRLQPWDVAGGALIVDEAVGQVTAMSGGRYSSREGSVLASNGLIHAQMLETIGNL
jgi:myo-inositol-1(or 4)-monophosphatase